MNNLLEVRSPAMALCLLLSTLAGCGVSSEQSRFYLLSPMSAASAPVDAGAKTADLTVHVVVELAEYADREEIVTRIGPNRCELADYDRWAESPRQSLTRVLAQNLSRLLGTERVIAGEWPGPSGDDYRIEVRVTRLDGILGAEAVLAARWRILDGGEKNVFLMRTSRFVEPADGDNYDALVAAESRALAAFSRELAAAIRALAADKVTKETQ